jgi:heme/copper-type cytochrome/quinol oxidase subunit 4
MSTVREEYEPHGEAHLPAEDQAHPGPREYVLIAVVLAVITGLEVALFYVEFLSSTAVVTALLLLMTIKFALVVLWFMHLRFDPPVFKRLFVTGLVLALSVFLIVLLTFGAGLGPAILAVAFVLVVLGVLLGRPRFLRRA